MSAETAGDEGQMWPFRKRVVRVLNDVDFGNISEGMRGCWTSTQFELWGYKEVQLLLDANENGPAEVQRTLCRDLLANTGNIRERVEAAVRQRIANTRGVMAPATNPIKLATIFFPADPAREHWRVWYDLEGEDIFWFGAEIDASGGILAFAED